jgi:hypothetical protein
MQEQYLEILNQVKNVTKEAASKGVFAALIVVLIVLASIIQPVTHLAGGNLFFTYFISGLVVLCTLAILAI